MHIKIKDGHEDRTGADLSRPAAGTEGAPAGTQNGPAGIPPAQTFQRDIYDRVIPLLPRDPSARILDVGAGSGHLSRRLMDLGYRVVACDFAAAGFRCPDIPFREADLNARIPAADGEFDCVVSVEVIEHLENHFRFISEMVRVTRPEGRIIVTTPNTLSLTSRLQYLLYGYTDAAPFPLDPDLEQYFMQHINPISLPELLFCLERFGADLVHLGTNRYRRSSWLPFLLLYPVLALAIRRKFLKKKHAALHPLHRRHIRWVMHSANLLGRITIVVGKKRAPAQ